MLPSLKCNKLNHQGAVQFICLNQSCREAANTLSCLQCVQDHHQHHKNDVRAIKVWLHSLEQQHHSQGGGYRKALIDNLKHCRSIKSFEQVVSEIIRLTESDPYEQILTHQMGALKQYSMRFLMQEELELESTRLPSEASLRMSQYIAPLFVFPPGNDYTLNSAHSVTHLRKEALTVVKAKPSLSSFPESVEISFYIKKIKPSWLAVGLMSSDANPNFSTEDSKGYYLWVSNGWLFHDNSKTPASSKFSVNQKITLRYDKPKQLLNWSKNGKFYEPKVLEINTTEWEELYPCVVFFNKDDEVDLFP